MSRANTILYGILIVYKIQKININLKDCMAQVTTILQFDWKEINNIPPHYMYNMATS